MSRSLGHPDLKFELTRSSRDSDSIEMLKVKVSCIGKRLQGTSTIHSCQLNSYKGPPLVDEGSVLVFIKSSFRTAVEQMTQTDFKRKIRVSPQSSKENKQESGNIRNNSGVDSKSNPTMLMKTKKHVVMADPLISDSKIVATSSHLSGMNINNKNATSKINSKLTPNNCVEDDNISGILADFCNTTTTVLNASNNDDSSIKKNLVEAAVPLIISEEDSDVQPNKKRKKKDQILQATTSDLVCDSSFATTLRSTNGQQQSMRNSPDCSPTTTVLNASSNNDDSSIKKNLVEAAVPLIISEEDSDVHPN
jgi:hypothetical protein